MIVELITVIFLWISVSLKPDKPHSYPLIAVTLTPFDEKVSVTVCRQATVAGSCKHAFRYEID